MEKQTIDPIAMANNSLKEVNVNVINLVRLVEELTKQKGSFAYPGLETVYENLPKQAKEVLPILGILGNASWSLHAVVAISQIEPSQVTIGLRQLYSSELITREEGNQFRVSPRQFHWAACAGCETGCLYQCASGFPDGH